MIGEVQDVEEEREYCSFVRTQCTRLTYAGIASLALGTMDYLGGGGLHENLFFVGSTLSMGAVPAVAAYVTAPHRTARTEPLAGVEKRVQDELAE